MASWAMLIGKKDYMSQELERAELHRALWKIANDLRGSVDGWDFKQYVLGSCFTVLSWKTSRPT